MNNEETLDLIRKAQAGDSSAEAALLLAHQGLIRRVAKRYDRGFGELPMDDLMQEGRIGFLLAVRRFDPSRETQFSTVATWWILKRIQLAVRRQPRWTQEQKPGRPGLQLETVPYAPQEPRRRIDVSPLLECLTPEQRDVIVYRFGLDGLGRRTLREAADLLGLSVYRARALTREAIDQIREVFPDLPVFQAFSGARKAARRFIPSHGYNLLPCRDSV